MSLYGVCILQKNKCMQALLLFFCSKKGGERFHSPPFSYKLFLLFDDF